MCNPPFVISDGEMRYSYRDSGLAGDGICQALVENIAAHLRPGGTAQLLANWIVREDTDWRERVGSWVADQRIGRLGGAARDGRPRRVCRAVVDRRRRGRKVDRIGPIAGGRLAENWLDYLAAERVQGIGMGLITLRRNGSTGDQTRR